jgi:LysR family transcriptional regulator, nod-box dependent transcriptional activator
VRFNKLDLNLLVALDALLAEKSITRAARKLNLSQSATSGVLARLRQYFDDDLLIQVGRTMVRTALANQLIGPVRDVLLEIQSTIESKPIFRPAESSRHFRIAASDYVICVVLSELVKSLSIEAPGITLEIMSPRDTTIEQAERGEIDFVLMPKAFSGLEGHSQELLHRDSYSCIAWQNNSLIKDGISREQCMTMEHVVTRFGERASTFEESVLHTAGIERHVMTSTSHFSTLPQLLIGTDRIAIMQTSLANISARYFPIRVFPMPIEIPQIEIMMRWHRFLDGDLAHQWMREQLRTSASAQADLARNASLDRGIAVH